MDGARQIKDARWMAETLVRFADGIVAAGGLPKTVLIGIRSRGPALARRVADLIRKKANVEVPVGALDITLYRDDFASRGPMSPKKGTELSVDLDGRTVYLIDDVLYTGRTIRAALDELMDFGRPKAVRLVNLIDRGGRELPIQPDFVGEHVQVEPSKGVRVRVTEMDGEDGVFEVPRKAGAEGPGRENRH